MSFSLILIQPNSIHPIRLNSGANSFRKQILALSSYIQTVQFLTSLMHDMAQFYLYTCPTLTFLFIYLSPSLGYIAGGNWLYLIYPYSSKVKYLVHGIHTTIIFGKKEGLTWKYFTNLLSLYYCIWSSKQSYEVDIFTSILQIGKLSLR